MCRLITASSSGVVKAETQGSTLCVIENGRLVQIVVSEKREFFELQWNTPVKGKS